MSFETKIVNGLVWPSDDSHCAAVVFSTLVDLEHAYAHCQAFEVAVQAGGNCGVWPRALADRFDTVYTFEPDPLNFYCLARNAADPRIIKFNAALGFHGAPIDLDRSRPNNCGAYQVGGVGTIPILRLDDLSLPRCDLLYLDIEGFELKALQGALTTILRCKPVIALEDKGLSERYGVGVGEAERWLAGLCKYRVVDRVGRDVILIP